uniref:Uncharacterized protein n=1 Tax=Romanomermis culicivorax TaxID=13658 RepID=A0A915K650_ROMCU
MEPTIKRRYKKLRKINNDRRPKNRSVLSWATKWEGLTLNLWTKNVYREIYSPAKDIIMNIAVAVCDLSYNKA